MLLETRVLNLHEDEWRRSRVPALYLPNTRMKRKAISHQMLGENAQVMGRPSPPSR